MTVETFTDARHPAPGRLALKLTPKPREGRIRLVSADASRLLLPIVLLLIWQGACSFGFVGPRTLESPLTVAQTLVELTASGVLWESLVASFKRAGLGFLIGGGLGLLLGVVAGLSRTGERAYDALLQMLRMVPFLAVIPLFVIWFGVDEEPKILLIALACIFPVYLNTFSGVRNVDPKIIEAATVFGMRRSAIATQIVAPLALPSIMVGIRYAMGVALLSLVAAEQVNATSGIGYLALNPRASLRTDIILGVVLLYSVLGLFVDFLIRTAQDRLLPWHRTILEKAR
ncbi:ABC transporter permease [Xanthobacter oligotrophicus]|uniref:ABC transporter permease n=1 Tax=Xanthobacter oligotrophicus TaxID=2607286 RepID=A0ABW6ZUX9_9HYPH